jgi:Domain of unknown function (DUF1707)/Cell wall-active antibiotics response 4TMS YvqF
VTSRPAPRDLRASDSDRDRVIELLSDAAADGRLTVEEHSERVERAHGARTLGELAVLTSDLVGPAAQPIRLDGKRAVAGVFGRDGRDGRWVVPSALPVLAICGEVELDLREALLQSGHIVIYATVICGTLHLIVPEGLAVEVNGTTLLTRRINRTVRQSAPARSDPLPPDWQPPVIEVRTVAICGTIRVTSPRKSRWLGGLRRNGLPR